MRYEVKISFTVKTNQGELILRPGKVIILAEEKATKLIAEGKIKPIEPYIDNETLVIPFDSDIRFHYWKGGQTLCDTLRELGRCDLIPKYRSIYSDN